MLGIVKQGLHKFEQYSDNNKIMKDLEDLKECRKTLTAQIAKYNSLKREYKRYQDISQDQGDSLVPLDFLNKHIEEVLDYEDTKLLVQSLRDSLQKIRENQKMTEIQIHFSFLFIYSKCSFRSLE
jgi:cell shape-determining protein MreC